MQEGTTANILPFIPCQACSLLIKLLPNFNLEERLQSSLPETIIFAELVFFPQIFHYFDFENKESITFRQVSTLTQPIS
jgi:hypothetical protein